VTGWEETGQDGPWRNFACRALQGQGFLILVVILLEHLDGLGNMKEGG
jgi:hypothetical protein